MNHSIPKPLCRVILSAWLLCCLALVFSATALGQKRRAKRSGAVPVAQGTADQNATQQDFDRFSEQAKTARESDKVEEAIELYRKALNIRRQWSEGWWYLATLYYDIDNYAEAARAFNEAAKLQPKSGAVWAMLGLCEFRLTKYDEAYIHIQKGRELGLGENSELIRVVRYHEGVIALLKGEFEKAQVTLGALSYEGLKSEELIIALGLSMLRMGLLPKQVDINYRDHKVVRQAGLAEHFSAQRNFGDATREYELLVKDYPKFPNVQYAYGRFLLSSRENDGALAAFQNELQNSPKHALARMQIAYIYLLNKEAAKGIPIAEEAVKLYPRLPLGHYILGRLLYDAGQTARAIEELEFVQRTTPTEPKIYFALTRAYSKANRKADAERARETFMRLNKQVEEDTANGNVGGDTLPDDNPGTNKPSQP